MLPPSLQINVNIFTVPAPKIQNIYWEEQFTNFQILTYSNFFNHQLFLHHSKTPGCCSSTELLTAALLPRRCYEWGDWKHASLQSSTMRPHETWSVRILWHRLLFQLVSKTWAQKNIPANCSLDGGSNNWLHLIS